MEKKARYARYGGQKTRVSQSEMATSPYAAYRKMVKKPFPEQMDESRLDAIIALYMRCAGHTVQEVCQRIIQTHPRPTDRTVTKG